MKLSDISAKLAPGVALALGLAVILSGQSKAPKPVNKGKKATPSAAAAKAPAAADAAAAGQKEAAVPAKRDPFLPLISEKKEGGTMEHLPPGKAGLVITTVRVDGTVRSPEGMIAVLSNADQHVYFVREGDQLYDGDVDKIGLDGVTFRQNSKDAFGKPVERVVTKRIYASAGEQQ
jgi:Tfp pilus assembly protein PilP